MNRLRSSIARSHFLRKLCFPIFSRFDFKIRIRHDLTGRDFYLRSWLHKGYWFYGLHREKDEIDRIRDLVNKGDTVLEIGSHIGYLTQFFESLVGENGKVIAVEPTEISRSLLKMNSSQKTTIVPLAMSNINGFSDFYLESFGGFTNSLIKDFTKGSNKTLNASQITKGKMISNIRIETKTVDTLCAELRINPDFIKIDVEGAELEVLTGALNVLKSARALMVEISRNHQAVYQLLRNNKFSPHDAQLNPIALTSFVGGNIFFVKQK